MLERNSSPRPRLGGHSSCSPEARSHIETYKLETPSPLAGRFRGEGEQKFDRFVNFVATKWN
jgi:hypothetical protein